MKLDRVRTWLGEHGYDGALFRTQPEIAWVTDGNEEPGLVWALVTATDAVLITTNIEEPRLRAEENLAGFELAAAPWYRPGSERLSVLGRDTASALEAALLSWHPSERECDVAERIAGALEERRPVIAGGRPAIVSI